MSWLSCSQLYPITCFPFWHLEVSTVPLTIKPLPNMFLCSVAQSCPALCNSMHCSLTDSSARGIFQARLKEWVVMPSLGDLPDPGIESSSFMSTALAGRFFISDPCGKPLETYRRQLHIWRLCNSLKELGGLNRHHYEAEAVAWQRQRSLPGLISFQFLKKYSKENYRLHMNARFFYLYKNCH